MNVTGVSGTAVNSPAPTPPAASAEPRVGDSPELVERDEVTNQPLPPRFPWLSRLSSELGKVARQPAPFAPAPVLGDNVDKSA